MVGFVIGKIIGNINMISSIVIIIDVGIMMYPQTKNKNTVIGITTIK